MDAHGKTFKNNVNYVTMLGIDFVESNVEKMQVNANNQEIINLWLF